MNSKTISQGNKEKQSFSHEDAITCISYDFYGERIACGSRDHTIQIWDQRTKDDGTKTWKKVYHWMAHNGVVIKVVWLPIEMGQGVISCGSDGMVKVWEEEAISSDILMQNLSINEACDQDLEKAPQGQVKWNLVHTVVDINAEITDIEFVYNERVPLSSHALLASSCIEGILRFHELLDIYHLTRWRLFMQVHMEWPISSISWSVNPLYPLMIAIGVNKKSERSFAYRNIEKTKVGEANREVFLNYIKNQKNIILEKLKIDAPFKQNESIVGSSNESLNKFKQAPPDGNRFKRLSTYESSNQKQLISAVKSVLKIGWDENDAKSNEKVISTDETMKEECLNQVKIHLKNNINEKMFSKLSRSFNRRNESEISVAFILYDKKVDYWRKIMPNDISCDNTKLLSDSVTSLRFSNLVSKNQALLAIASDQIHMIGVMYKNNKLQLTLEQTLPHSYTNSVTHLKWSSAGTLLAASGFSDDYMRAWKFENCEWKLTKTFFKIRPFSKIHRQGKKEVNTRNYENEPNIELSKYW